MTLDEATTICRIMTTADNGCVSCATCLLESFSEAFPEFKVTITEDWYGVDLDNDNDDWDNPARRVTVEAL